MRTCTLLATLTVLASQAYALTSQSSEHIVIGLVPGEYNVGTAIETEGTEPVGILTFNHECPAVCTVEITQGVQAHGCECRPREE